RAGQYSTLSKCAKNSMISPISSLYALLSMTLSAYSKLRKNLYMAIVILIYFEIQLFLALKHRFGCIFYIKKRGASAPF
ncbi:MAG: hypothetical protein EAZ89_14350, partial [Bacteroidetes bacterium]